METIATRAVGWARRLLVAALLLSLLSGMGGLLVLLTVWLLVPLFIGSCLLYTWALPARPTSREWLGYAVAATGAGASLLVVASTSHFRWLLPCWAAGLLATAWAGRHPGGSRRWRAGAVALGFVLLPVAAFRATSLQTAVEANDLLWAKVLFAFGADANERAAHGFGVLNSPSSTPVLAAALDAGQLPMLRLLLAHGANPNARVYTTTAWKGDTLQSSTPVLFQPIWNKQIPLVRLLLAAEADPQARDHLGRDAAQIACDYDYPDSLYLRKATGQRAPRR